MFPLQMSKLTLCLVAGAILLGVVACVKCPDGHQCTDQETCCQGTKGYNCCPYPDAVCCSDKTHCCPSGYTCNLAEQMCEKQNLPWFRIPMVMKEAEKSSASVLPVYFSRGVEDSRVPAEEKSSVLCDDHYRCPDGTTCCKNSAGGWSCCPYSPGSCCQDGYHCCPRGYHCDPAYRYCLQQGLRYPFTARKQPPVVPAALIVASEERSGLLERPMMPLRKLSDDMQDAGGVQCDSTFVCPADMTCCKGPQGQWSCCPFRLGQCCGDGQHCCEYGYTCSSSVSCKKSFSQ
ncbi:hypothetical protein fugu_018370 [Takifugu bimaculatus]|uniref:Granulins domain-containing protein n=1 Tax=Takifugu bimaculatus TaxID=433685 RepID=A0A4Z2BMP6_9TELE|nr:hypothetical protein fugu_018370 [Takifugu bimaculatus]